MFGLIDNCITFAFAISLANLSIGRTFDPTNKQLAQGGIF